MPLSRQFNLDHLVPWWFGHILTWVPPRKQNLRQRFLCYYPVRGHNPRESREVTGKWGRERQDEDNLSYWLLLHPTDCLILQDCPSENHLKYIIVQSIREEKGERLYLPAPILYGSNVFPTDHSQLHLGGCLVGFWDILHLCGNRESPGLEMGQVRWSLCDVSQSSRRAGCYGGIRNKETLRGS